MSYPLLSLEWIEHYKELWNKNEKAIDGTKGLGALVEMAVSDIEDRPAMQFSLNEDGTADYAGPVQPGKTPVFRMIATTETWRQVGYGEMGVKRAVTTGPIQFKGSLVKALKYYSGLEAAMLQFADVPTAEWKD